MAKSTAATASMSDAMAAVRSIPLSQLKLAEEAPAELGLVVRKSRSTPESDAELKANIAHYGIILPLVFKHYKGQNYVTAGNRRLRLARELYGADSAATIGAIDTALFPGHDPREIALATNISLPPHPVDRYDVIAMLLKEGMKPKDAQLRFSMSDRQLGQVMAVAKLSPVVREAWRSAKIDAATAHAFTLCPDKKEQEKIFARLDKSGDLDNDWRVRDALLPVKQRDVGKFAEFAGREFEKAGGKITRDMFGTDHQVDDVSLLKSVAQQKLADEAAKLVKAGWAWAINKPQNSYMFSHSKPDNTKALSKAQQDAVIAFHDEEPLPVEGADLVEILTLSYSPALRARAGCFVDVSEDGGLAVDFGLIKPEERKKVETQERAKTTKAKKAKARAAGAPVEITKALTERLAMQIARATKAALQLTATSTRDPLHAQLCAIVAMSINSDSAWNTYTHEVKQRIDAIREAIDAKVMNKTVATHADLDDYFGSVSREACGAALIECGYKEKLPAKKADAAKLAIAFCGKADWLPPQLRTIHYDGPQAKKVAAKKPAKKGGRR